MPRVRLRQRVLSGDVQPADAQADGVADGPEDCDGQHVAPADLFEERRESGADG